MQTMSNNGNTRSHAWGNGQPRAKQKLARRQQLKEDQKRSDLLARILEESSSIKLNERTSQLNARQALEDHSLLFDLIAELRQIESRLNPELPKRDERSWSKFIKWYSSEELKLEQQQQPDEPTHGDTTKLRLFDRVGIKRRSAESALGDDNSEEHALVAKVPIKRGEKIFEIDRSLMLTTETAMKDSDLYDFIKKDSIASGMPNVVLVLHLLNEFNKGEQSRWWPYLSILPSKILPILQMNKKQMSIYLMASANLHSSLKMLRAITRQYSYFYKRLQSTTLPIRHKFTLLLYTWGVSVVCSRQNEIPQQISNDLENADLNCNHDKKSNIDQSNSSQPKSVHALIPVLDMCNHDPKSNQATFEHNMSCLEAASDLSPNHEITLNYGSRSSGDFFIHNGFVPHEVTCDTVGFILALNQKEGFLTERRARMLETFGITTTCGEFTLRSRDFYSGYRCDLPLTAFLMANFLEDAEIGFVLDSSDLNLIAKELFRRVHKTLADWLSSKEDDVHELRHDNLISDADREIDEHEAEILNKIAKRLSTCIEEYLYRRASVGIALVDRSLENLKEPQIDDVDYRDQTELKFYITRLLRHEKEVYEGYLIK